MLLMYIKTEAWNIIIIIILIIIIIIFALGELFIVVRYFVEDKTLYLKLKMYNCLITVFQNMLLQEISLQLQTRAP